VLTVKAERPALNGDRELIAAERPRGSVQPPAHPRRQPGHRERRAAYNAGVLTVRIPVAEQAKPRKIMISSERATGRRSTPDRQAPALQSGVDQMTTTPYSSNVDQVQCPCLRGPGLF
jgi:hypothetical protein